MDPNVLREVILEQKHDFERKDDFIPRTLLDRIGELLKLPHVLVISGLRRAGKSTLLREIYRAFYKDRVVYFLNFEDERLLNFGVEDFNLLYEVFVELYGKGGVFLFDEVQNVSGWEVFVRRMYDKGFKFILTGSNSSMLSRELGSKLTGRYIGLELYPFSFGEFLTYKGIKIPKVFLTEDRGMIKNAFKEYRKDGGIPEYLVYGRSELLRTLYESILYKDILVRYGLSDEKALKELGSYIFSNYGSEISYSGLKTMLNLGSLNTVKNYLNYLENSYLVFTISRYDYSVKKQIYSRKKIYVIDTALINLLSVKFSENTGRMLENTVFIELKRRGNEVYYHRDRHECDFITLENKKITAAIQVTTSLKNNKEREYTGLIEALEKYKIETGVILTENEEYEEEIENKKIKVRPVWKWLLEE